MTPWLGRLGFGEAPTRAIVFVSWRICSGVLMARAILPAHVRHAACRLRPAYEPGRQGGESREGGRWVARGAARGADIVVLPEKWNAIGNSEELHAAAERLEDGESVAAMAS